MEKLLAKIFTYSVKLSVQAIYFENVSLAKMKEFKLLLDCLKKIENIIEDLYEIKENFTSSRLKSLLDYQENGGLMPSNIKESLKEFEKLIVWKAINGDKNVCIPEPQPGIDQTFDDANKLVDSIKSELESYL